VVNDLFFAPLRLGARFLMAQKKQDKCCHSSCRSLRPHT
jgi:hypothetical protein